ncbi:MAG: carbohydrate kinase family protein [Verrucomicrobiae bacterium]|nr:carbohydrate kinase family protein [Verrucomicrobiae bacterium]MDW8343281.1 carbohydrate kinase family protein [Verrucomicrobiae bacterium]
MSASPEIVVAGHICLDIIPRFPRADVDYRAVMQPGKLVFVDPPVISTGGAVANTGLALHRLGVPTGLMGKVGDDLFGHAILDVIRSHAPALAEPMIVDRTVASSYTVVINPPHVDRMFLHCPGANDTFTADDVRDEMLRGARLFHFGYPPLMRRFYADSDELARLFRRVKSLGLTTSLDMAFPDPNSEAGRAPWPVILQRALPHVDIFLPSLDEMRFMLRRDSVREIAQQLLDWGAGVVGLKLGEDGLYVRTRDGEWHAPCFQTTVVGTTGAGDCTIAGFLAGWIKGLPLPEIITMAVAVGACNVEAADATSGIIPWDRVVARVRAGWPRRPSAFQI